MEQRTPEWRKARLGIPTASNFKKIVKPDGGPSASAQDYMCRLIGERILGRSLEEDISNLKWVRHGIDYEDEAVAEFEAISGEQTAKVGFVPSKDGRWGCSPDRIIPGKNAAVEIKCPALWTHIEYLLYGQGKDYKQQVQGQMLVGGYDMVYFFSYFPGMPAVSRLTVRDESFLVKLRAALVTFSENLDKETEKFISTGPIDLDRVLAIMANLMPEREE